MTRHKVVLIAILFWFVVAICAGLYASHQSKRAAQAAQDRDTAAAVAEAASEAMGTVDGRVGAEKSVDAAVDRAMKDIRNATDPNTVHRTVRGTLCMYPEYRNDPACTVRDPSP